MSSVADLKGEQVNVRVARTGELRPGDSKVFFTNALVFGKHLEVGEVGHMASPDNRSEMRRQILAVRAQMAVENLRARAAGASLVVAG
jgi:hypothetical protein